MLHGRMPGVLKPVNPLPRMPAANPMLSKPWAALAQPDWHFRLDANPAQSEKGRICVPATRTERTPRWQSQHFDNQLTELDATFGLTGRTRRGTDRCRSAPRLTRLGPAYARSRRRWSGGQPQHPGCQKPARLATVSRPSQGNTAHQDVPTVDLAGAAGGLSKLATFSDHLLAGTGGPASPRSATVCRPIGL